MIQALATYFQLWTNIPHERHLFRSMTQQPKETLEWFVTRIKENAIEEQIRDQVVEKCHSNHLRRRFSKKGTDLSLKILREIALVYETTEEQISSFSRGEQSKIDNRLKVKQRWRTKSS